MHKSVCKIPKMDCPSEENLIRVKSDGMDGIRQLEFDYRFNCLLYCIKGRFAEIEIRKISE